MNFYPILASMQELKENEPMLMTVVTICGVLIVFVALILLIIIFSLFGKAMTAGQKKTTGTNTAAPKANNAPKTKAAPAAAPAAVPAASNGIPDEIIAVIAAAVASMSDGAYAIRSVRRASEGRPAWSMAGIYENTRPF